jgi:hypothetical protein
VYAVRGGDRVERHLEKVALEGLALARELDAFEAKLFGKIFLRGTAATAQNVTPDPCDGRWILRLPERPFRLRRGRDLMIASGERQDETENASCTRFARLR